MAEQDLETKFHSAEVKWSAEDVNKSWNEMFQKSFDTDIQVTVEVLSSNCFNLLLSSATENKLI